MLKKKKRVLIPFIFEKNVRGKSYRCTSVHQAILHLRVDAFLHTVRTTLGLSVKLLLEPKVRVVEKKDQVER